jgi:CarD family transcriptional regulator
MPEVRVQFKVGSKVVYPSHGVAQIVGREKKVLDGKKVSYLILSVPERGWGTAGDMKVSVPEDRAEDLGVRFAVSEEDAEDKSGDVYQHAEVVRNLAHRQRNASLSTAEKSMYARARHILISELAVSWNVDEEKAEARVDAALGLVKG